MTIMRKDSEYGGELEISIDSVEQGILKYEVNDISADKYYKITISDTGVGINQDYLDSIFDPFFTTKSNTVGSGLGLSMVYNMIKKHHGHIKVESKVGIGSTFNIYLPAVSGEQILESKKNKNADRGSGNILVIDDEEIVRNMISKMLELSGYTVYCASGGAEGLDMLDQMIDSIDLVILDMAMPEMSGDEVFDVIREKYNNVKVLLSSGFRQDNRVQKVIDKGVNGFISKPYEIKELTETVLRILNS